jgi:hypothetical protein
MRNEKARRPFRKLREKLTSWYFSALTYWGDQTKQDMIGSEWSVNGGD